MPKPQTGLTDMCNCTYRLIICTHSCPETCPQFYTSTDGRAHVHTHSHTPTHTPTHTRPHVRHIHEDSLWKGLGLSLPWIVGGGGFQG